MAPPVACAALGLALLTGTLRAPLAGAAGAAPRAAEGPHEPNYRLNATELIRHWGYPLEVHPRVSTEDRYLLTLLRIPGARRGSGGRVPGGDHPGPPVLLQHGLLDSAATFLVNEPSESLAYLLADAGFDVWLGNARGNDYSLGHEVLTHEEPAFWDFSFDEHARYDLPAMVDYVLARSNEGRNDTTAFSRVGYVGHSQGTLMMFLALSTLGPSFAAKIAHFNALAPVGRIAHMSSVLFDALAKLDVDELFRLFGASRFLAFPSWLKTLSGDFCGHFPPACEDVIFLACGRGSPPNLNRTRFDVYIYNTPAGTSVRNVAHFGQLFRHGWLRRFDYGSAARNLARYGQAAPPAYDLRSVQRVPMTLFSGSRDALADPQDLAWLRAQLEESGKFAPGDLAWVAVEGYQHLDFTWGVDAKDRIYPAVLASLRGASYGPGGAAAARAAAVPAPATTAFV